MKKKPLLFSIVPLILIGICASFYFQTAFVLDANLTDYKLILTKLTFYNWLTIFFAIVSGIAILRSSHWSKFFIPMTIAIVFLNNYLVATYTNNFTKTQILLAAILFALLFTPLYTPKMRRVLFDRNMQWWKNAFRKKNKIPVSMRTDSGSYIQCQSHDVSKTGLFLRFDSESWSLLPKKDEKVQLVLTLNPNVNIPCSATVVRLVESKGFYPRGMGLQIKEIKSMDQKILDSFLNQSHPN